MTGLLALALAFSPAHADVLSKCQDVPGSSSVTASYTPAQGQIVFLQRLSTAAPSVSGARGFLLWDGAPIDGWTGDKVFDFPDNEPAFTLTGDGVKTLQIKLENTSTATTYRICGLLIYKTN